MVNIIRNSSSPWAAPLALALLAASLPAHSQSAQTWVSSFGADTDACSREAPCRTFNGALGKTNAGGTVNVLDPGAYGPLTINKSVTIDGGREAVLVSGSGSATVVTIDATAGPVLLQNLRIVPGNGAVTAVRIASPAAVNIEGVTISGFARGVDLAASARNSHLSLRNVQIGGAQQGVIVDAAGAQVLLYKVTLSDSVTGLAVSAGNSAVTESHFLFNGTAVGLGAGDVASFGDNRFLGNTLIGRKLGRERTE